MPPYHPWLALLLTVSYFHHSALPATTTMPAILQSDALECAKHASERDQALLLPLPLLQYEPNEKGS